MLVQSSFTQNHDVDVYTISKCWTHDTILLWSS